MAKQKEKIVGRSAKSKVITVLLGVSLFCVFSLLLFLFLDDRLFFGVPKKCKNNSITNLSYEKIAGTYVREGSVFEEDNQVNEDGTAFFDYDKLTINADGTAKYESNGNREGIYAEGQLLVGKKGFYLVNENCVDMIVQENQCVYPNCPHVIELTYNNGVFTTDEKIELIKK